MTPELTRNYFLDRIINFIRKYKYHFISWAILIIYEVGVVKAIRGHFDLLSNYAVHYVLNILLFYVHAHLTLQKSLGKRFTFILLPVIWVVEIACYIFLTYYLEIFCNELFNWKMEAEIAINRVYIIRCIWRAMYFNIFSTGYFFLINFIKERKKSEEYERDKFQKIIESQRVEKELIVAKNAYLKAQINPHFLFNTLNFIYNKSRKTAPVAADAIIILAEMMRYAVRSDDEPFVSLSEEIEQVENLINLHKLKTNGGLYLEFNYNEDVGSVKMIPLVLMTLTENIFKHGVLDLPDSPASISISVDEFDTFTIETSNLASETKNNSGLGSGLNNIRDRILFFYGPKVVFKTDVDNRNYFNLFISISEVSVTQIDGFSSLKVSESTHI